MVAGPYNVPNVPGVPALNFVADFALPVLLTGDLTTQFSGIFGPQWGIFQDGELIITAESVVGFEFRADWTISDYPVEGGIFESYDKVTTPFLAKVRFASGSSPEAREALLANVDAVAGLSGVAAGGELPIYDVVTPEFTYTGASISHYDYRRVSNQGVGLIIIDVWVSQVLVQTQGASNVQNPSSADPQQNGLVSPQPAIGSGSTPGPTVNDPETTGLLP